MPPVFLPHTLREGIKKPPRFRGGGNAFQQVPVFFGNYWAFQALY